MEDKLDDTNEAASYFSMRAYQYSKDSADGPSAVAKGSWQLEDTGIVGRIIIGIQRQEIIILEMPMIDLFGVSLLKLRDSGCSNQPLGVRGSNELGWYTMMEVILALV